MLQTEQTLSIYRQIKAGLDQDGHLSPDFSLPDEGPSNQPKFAPGAMDGIGIYHMAPQDVAKEAVELADMVRRACKGLTEELVAELTSFLDEHRMLFLADPFLQNIREDLSLITPNEIYELGQRLMTESTDVELTKLGIVLTGILDIENDQPSREALLALAQYDEFTLYVLVIVGVWKDGQQQILELAKNTHSWGKIHALERLEPTTPEVKDWIIAHGCENGVMNAYSALTCAQKGDLLACLNREELPEELFRGAGVILTAMLDEGPVAGISAYEDVDAALERYLIHAAKYDDLETLSNVLAIKSWLEEKHPNDTLRSWCFDTVMKPHWDEAILGSVETDIGDALWRACHVAGPMGVNIVQPLFGRIVMDPIAMHNYIPYVCKSPEEMDNILTLYGQMLPLDTIATGMGDELGLGKEFENNACLDTILQMLQSYPGKGLAFVKAGLSSPVVRNRNMALRVLEAWNGEGHTPSSVDEELPKLLLDLLQVEVDHQLKLRISDLLNPRTEREPE